jgi:hypothetical protein
VLHAYRASAKDLSGYVQPHQPLHLLLDLWGLFH